MVGIKFLKKKIACDLLARGTGIRKKISFKLAIKLNFSFQVDNTRLARIQQTHRKPLQVDGQKNKSNFRLLDPAGG